MRKLGWALLIVVVLLAGAAAMILPGWIERQQNQIDGRPLPPVSAHAKALHATLTIVDLHADTLLWQRSLLDRADAATSTCRGSRRAMSRCRSSRR